MKFAHLSDFHLTLSDQKNSPLRNDLVGAITTVICDLKSIENHLDFVSITGDLTENGDTASYLKLKELFGELSVPVYFVPGNHDLRQPFSQILGITPKGVVSEKLDYRAAFGSVQIVGLDTLVEGETTGALDEAQLSLLKEILFSTAYSHSVISLHHPPFTIGHSEFDPMSTLVGSEEMGEIVTRAKSKVTILCGHVHRPYQAQWNGANCYISGGPSFQMGSGFFFGDEALSPVDEPFTYYVHSIDGAGDHVVGTRFIKLAPAYTSHGAENGGAV
ncbi:MAG: Icc protein [Granulosicoccus sp.]|jgi:3',5'-cyclic AMP phosphodiesterase CpdA